MEFRILGPLEVREGGRPIHLGSAKQRALLAILLLNAGRVVSRDRLIEELWGGEPPEGAVKALQVHVSQLRKLLERGASAGRILKTRAPGYMIEPEPEQFDLHRFEELAREGKAMLTAGDAAGASVKLREALALSRGPALAEFALEPFAQSELVLLEELRLAALGDRIEADLQLGRHADLVGELEALVAQHPLHERLWYQLMLALYRSGRQAGALEAYRRARQALVEELGIEPSRALQELERSILRQDALLEPPPASPPALEAAPEAPAPPAAPEPPPAERKLVTVLFADLVSSTELGAEEDPERTRTLLDRFYDAMATEIEGAGGTIEKFIGDAVVAVFGAPAAQEDHAERALHAALSMRQRLAELFGDRLSLHVGVNTGEVVLARAREGGSFVTGDAVNVAARLQQTARAGEILVGERTAAAARGAFEFGEAHVVAAKGKREGVACRRLVAAVSRTRPRGIGGLAPAFVGRESELELLHATYRRAVRDGEPQLVTLMGEAGVGKTSLARELWEQLAAESPEPLQRFGRCLPYGRGITYWPLGEVLKQQLGLLDSDPPETVRSRLGDREILGLALGLEAGPDLAPVVARERLHQAWVELVEGLVLERPVVLVVEDLHWAEGPLFELLDRLAQDVRGPLLLLATARPELHDRRPAWGAGRRNVATVWLEPLSSEESERMVTRLLAGELPSDLRSLVVDHAEGNPFFVEELVAALVDQGVLEQRDGRWSARELPSGFAVPDSVQAVLASRIDLLPRAEKAALQAASVIGRTFWAGPVRALLGGPEPDYATLEHRDFVRRRPHSSFEGEREFAFKHALTRDVAYGSLPKARRARLHAAFAGWLERAGEGRDEHAPLLAHHFAEAVRPEHLDSAWPGEEDEVERLRGRALAWLRRAAELAASRYDLDEEIALLQRAVELEADEERCAEHWRAIGRANALKYEKDGFREAMLKAVEHAADPQKRAGVLGELAFQVAFRWNHAEDRERIETWVEQALALADQGSAARAWALVARSYCRPEEAEEAAREATAIAERLPDPEVQSYAFHARGDSVLARGRYDDARGWAERRLELLREIGDPDHVADIYWSAIPGYLGRGRFADARRLAELHDEVTRELTPHHRLHGVAFVLEVEELAGNWARIRELAARAEEAALASTPCVHRPRSLLVCALASACLGDEDEAHRLERVADSLGGSSGAALDAQRVRLALMRGDLATVRRLLAAAEKPGQALIRSTKLAPVAARLDALAALGERKRIEAEAPPLLRTETYLEPFALRALGITRGDKELLERAAARFEAMGLAWHASETIRQSDLASARG